MAMYTFAFKAVVMGIFGSLFTIGVIGNALVVILVTADRRMRSVPNLFISQLAISDFLILFFCMPFTIVSLYIYEEWPFGEKWCKVVKFFQTMAVYISILTLMAMSFERYFVLIYSMKARAIWTRRVAMGIMAVIIAIAAVSSLPRPLMSKMAYLDIPVGISESSSNISNTTSIENLGMTYQRVMICFDEFPTPFVKVYYGTRVIVFYLLPVVVISILYGRIISHIRATNRQQKKMTDNVKVIKERQNVVRMLIMMITLFILCWLIYHVVLVFQMFDLTAPLVFGGLDNGWIMFFNAIFIYSNCVTNPIIYSFMSTRFRQGFIRILCGCKCAKGDDDASQISASRSGRDPTLSTVSEGISSME